MLKSFVVAALTLAVVCLAPRESHAQITGPMTPYGAFGNPGFGYGFYPYSTFGVSPPYNAFGQPLLPRSARNKATAPVSRPLFKGLRQRWRSR